MSPETSPLRYSVPRTRRIYSAQFKAELIAACLQPGASIAATAREHGMNANVLHRWLKEHRLGQHQITCDTAPAVACDIAARLDNEAAPSTADAQSVEPPAHRPHAGAVPAFIAMALGSPVMELPAICNALCVTSSVVSAIGALSSRTDCPARAKSNPLSFDPATHDRSWGRYGKNLRASGHHCVEKRSWTIRRRGKCRSWGAGE